ncbi:MAG TPA: site-specific DNA-methyltransferase [Candidatus Acidoferrales bacterium]|nr:site-specific DNA-methyltransferase [Candidatus Acidoferrales bacterium]
MQQNVTTGKEDLEKYLKSEEITPYVLNGDVLSIINLLPEKSIDLIITSPPYWQQRDYGIENQIGREATPEEYINKLLTISNKLKRVLKDTGSFFLNIGDKYNSKKKQLLLIPSRLAFEMQKNEWVLRNQIVWYKPNHMPSPLLDRCSNTWEPVFFFVKDTGTYLAPKYYFNLDAIRVEHKTKEPDIPPDLPITVTEEEYKQVKHRLEAYKKDYNGKFLGQKINLGASPGARSSVNGYFYSKQRIFKPTDNDEIEIISFLRDWREQKGLSIEEIDKLLGYSYTAGHWFRLDRGGRSLPSPKDWIKLKEILGFDDRYDERMTKTWYVLQAVKKSPLGKNPGDMWSIQTDKFKEAHFSIFPEELVRRIIQAACPPNGVVLDHFAGSGTTGKVAMELGRKSIMIEINPDYVEIMHRRFLTEKNTQLSDFY